MEHIQGNIRLLCLAKASAWDAEGHRFKPDILQEWKGYSAAACYIDNARRSMFGNIRRCLK